MCVRACVRVCVFVGLSTKPKNMVIVFARLIFYFSGSICSRYIFFIIETVRVLDTQSLVKSNGSLACVLINSNTYIYLQYDVPMTAFPSRGFCMDILMYIQFNVFKILIDHD